MLSTQSAGILVENHSLSSNLLLRDVIIDIYYPPGSFEQGTCDLLLINDGQDMESLGLKSILNALYTSKSISPILCVGIHCGPERKMEYGVAGHPDFKGRGAKGGLYDSFIIEELLPFLRGRPGHSNFSEISIAGFSLGGLSAFDLVWNHPEIFRKCGVFSGSFWWRSVDQTAKEYSDNNHRIMHQVVRNGHYSPGLKFFFQCGNNDETRDRNNNGVIDSVDDTLDLIHELEVKGYSIERDIKYLLLKDGRHDVDTWAAAMPTFLEWGWGWRK